MKVIREGDLVRVEWGRGREVRGTVIRVAETRIVFRPEDPGSGEFPRGQDRLTVRSESDLNQSSAAGNWCTSKGADYTFELQPEGESSQRRSYFRTSVQFSLALHQDSTYRILLIEDLSGGGCRCRIEPHDGFDEGEQYVGFLNLEDGNGSIELELTVVRVESGTVAFYFAVIHEKKRQRILQALFREYRAKRAAARSTSGVDGVPG